MQILLEQVWGGASDSAFLLNFLVIHMLLVPDYTLNGNVLHH